ncbi:hypothetical protein [Streptomyces sp. CC210A]|uniref:hypothetical protein n=1 Tax=Streptomyces sp. CC210A TaxID=2898184 RepID=UPI001F33F0A1|nr:hypothetical protein [Streptomyces sp. CC210A]
MAAVPEMSGVDLARQALLAVREAAKKNGAQTPQVGVPGTAFRPRWPVDASPVRLAEDPNGPVPRSS